MDRVDRDAGPKNEGSINFAKSDGRSCHEYSPPGCRTGKDQKFIRNTPNATPRTCAKDGRKTLQTEGERNLVGADGNTPSNTVEVTVSYGSLQFASSFVEVKSLGKQLQNR